MYYLDFTTNTDYYDENIEQQVTGMAALKVYSYTLSYNTLIDEAWTGREQRRDAWVEPRRKWVLEFQKEPTLGRKLEEFFNECKGRKKAFKFKWSKYDKNGEDLGGDDNWYFVRFNSDDITIEIDYLGFRHTTLEIVEVRNEL